ncbi:hypothetical protein [Parabacteroides gordonii]|uniref:hypothetical protein n=1 Tax=Parabacteroides gordonii TaxID=574930 RepID=UPI0026EC9627|nr:hypothetical protein [Parabacteroides gordonii]
METRNIYFFGNEVNRVINKENVKNIYFSIDKWGFQPAVSKIKKIKAKEGDKIYGVTIVPDKNSKPISIDNWACKLREVTDSNELNNVNPICDGQHTAIALSIMEAESKLEYKDEYEEVIEVPKDMSTTQFVNLLNSGRAWTNKDFKGKLSTGNEYIDYMERKIVEEDYVSDFIHSIYTVGTAQVNDSLVKSLKCGRTDKMPKKLKLNADTQDTGNKLVKAFEDSTMSKEAYNNGKLGKGLKQFAKDNSLDTDTLVRVINAMSKDVWYAGKKPAGSAEASNYAENFKKWYESINK